MAWIIIFAIIFFVYAWHESGFECSIFGLFVGAFIGALGYMSIGFIAGFFIPTHVTYVTAPLYALSDSSAHRGSTFLFSSTVDNRPVIKYISDTDKGKRIYQVDASSSYIVEDDSQTPHVDVGTEKFNHEWHNWFAITGLSKEYIFYIPEGSVTNQFSVDLE